MNDKQTKARQLAAKVAKLSDETRQALADKMDTVVNPQSHALSVHNTIFLYMQCQRTDLTIVAGFKQWIKAGRCVRKGEHSLGYISVPMQLRDKRPQAAAEDTVLRFRLVPVFDVSQTDNLEVTA